MDETRVGLAGSATAPRNSVRHGRWRGRLATALAAAAVLCAASARAQGVLENPQPGSAKSGIGVISGWKCTAAGPGAITVTIDGGTPIQAAYGTSRTDTEPVCGDANNGWGVLFNFGLLADGEHSVVARDAGVEFARATFDTSSFGVSFVTGASGVAFVRDFPLPNEGAFLVWEQGSQGFTVGGTCGVPDRIDCPPAVSQTGWLYADRESAPGSYAPGSGSSNSVDQPNSVRRLDVGVYEATFGALGVEGPAGTVHVTARQANASSCTIEGWFERTGDRVVAVRCFDAAGAPADTRFDVVYTRPAAGTDIRGYLWAGSPASDDYVPSLLYQLNTAGPLARVRRLATGVYRADLPVLAGGQNVGVMLSAYGETPVRCRVLDYGVSFEQRFGVDVLCQDVAGAVVDAAFTLSVIRNAPLAPLVAVSSAYLRMRNPATPEVAPDESFNSTGDASLVTRLATGRYLARLGSLGAFGAAGNVQVTAVGTGASHCKVESVADAGADVDVIVLCFDGAAPSDAEFALTYTE